MLKERRGSHFDEALQYPDENDTAVVRTRSRGDEHVESRREQDSSTKHPADQSVHRKNVLTASNGLKSLASLTGSDRQKPLTEGTSRAMQQKN